MKIDGPIPGANYTSDTKNYPWHRPPQFNDLDDAIEEAGKRLLNPDTADGILTLMSSGVDIVTLTDMIVEAGVGAGRWTVDFAVLMAGPVSHILVLMAEAYGVTYKMGLEKKDTSPSKHFFEAIKIDEGRLENAMASIDLSKVQTPDEVAPSKSSGFMGMKPKGVSENNEEVLS